MGLLSTIGAASGRAFGLTRVGAAIRDAYFNLTTLLLPGNGTNGAQNNTFLDSSSNNFTITRNGNTTQGTFSPFSQTGWSAYNASTGSGSAGIYLGGQTDFAFGTGDFTIELWIYLSSSGQNQVVYDSRPSGTNGLYPTIYLNNSTTKLTYFTNSADRITQTSTFTYNTWHHVVVTRTGTSTKMFVDGTQEGSTYTDSNNYINGTDRPFTGDGSSTTGPAGMVGYISNLRVVKGSGPYQSAGSSITVPTSPLTPVTNTVLLTLQSNRYVDTNTQVAAKTITTFNSTSIQAFSPFAPTAAYSAATVGGSGYFDGTGDSLSVAYNSAFDFGTGDFTIEAWVYLTATPAESSNILGSLASGGTNFEWRNATQIALGSNGLAWRFTSNSTTFPLNTWIHLAVTRASGTAYMWMNGVSIGSGAETTAFNAQSSAVYIGQSGGGYFRGGYISSLRVTKGGSLYTTGFTPPTGPLTTTVSSGTVSLLCNYTNAGITDATAKNVLETVGNAQISTTQSKFGGSSMYFDGVGDNLTIPSSPLRALGTSDFTIEFWFNASSIPQFAAILDMRNPNTDNIGFDIMFYFYKISFGTATSVYIAGTTTLSTGTWYHYALTRSGNTFKQFLNGTQEGTTYTGSSTQNFTNTLLKIADGSNGPYTGYLDDIRITRGYARYTSNFTPPTAAYPTQ